MTASKSIGDLEYAYFLQGPPALDGNGNIKVGQVGAVDNSQVANRYASTSNSGTQTAPGAGTAIATLAVFDFYYRVEVVVGFGATAESTAINNMQLKAGSNVVATVPVNNVANSQSQTYVFFVNPGGSVNLTVNAISAASASSVYKATVTATRLS